MGLTRIPWPPSMEGKSVHHTAQKLLSRSTAEFIILISVLASMFGPLDCDGERGHWDVQRV